jgi:hypothetical protein
LKNSWARTSNKFPGIPDAGERQSYFKEASLPPTTDFALYVKMDNLQHHLYRYPILFFFTILTLDVPIAGLNFFILFVFNYLRRISHGARQII